METGKLIKCPICRAETRFIYETSDHEGGERFFIYRCPKCTVEFIENPPADLAKYYDDDAGKTMTRSNRFLDFLFTLVMKVEFGPIFQIANFTHACVLGAGSGYEVSYFKKRNILTSSVDFQTNENRSKNDIVADLNDLPALLQVLRGKNFDLVSMRHVLEHVKNPLGTLETLQEAKIKYVNIIVPNGDSIYKKIFGPYWCHYDPPRHLFVLNSNSLQTLVQQTKYRIRFTRFHGNDEIFLSIFRYLSLHSEKNKWVQILKAKSIISTLSSSFFFFFSRSSIQVFLELGAQE